MTQRELQKRLRDLQSSANVSRIKSDRERELEEVNHELEVHQIELEIQNRELIDSRRAVEEAHDRFVNLYDFAPVAYVTTDRQGIIREINLTAASLLGTERQRLWNRSLISWVVDADRPKFREHLSATADVGASATTSLRLTGSGNKAVPVQLQSTCVHNESTDELWLRIVISDLTEHQQFVERLENEKLLREKFVLELSHDLRSPLSAAKIGAQMIIFDEKPESAQWKRASQIVKSVDRMDRMIRDLLDANRIQAGQKFPLVLDHVELVELANAAVDELKLMYGERVQISFEKAITALCDGKAVRRVIENLVSNAVKYGAKDRPIRVTLAEQHGWVEIAVHNEGEPISPEDQKSLFRAFRRTDSAHQSGQQGWGIGLTLVRGVAEAHGGKAEVESSPESGTRFSILIPVDPKLRNP